MRNDIALEIDENRRKAWIERGRIPERDPVPLRFPLVQTLVVGGAGFGAFGAKDEAIIAVAGTVAARLIPTRMFAFELGAGMSTIAPGSADRYRAFRLEPAALVCLCDIQARYAAPGPELHSVLVWLRGAIDVGIPFDGESRSPDVLVALKAGFEFDVLVARVGDGGFASAVLQTSFFGRLAGGGETSVSRRPSYGVEVFAGPSFAF